MTFDDSVSALSLDSLLTEVAVEMCRNPLPNQRGKAPPWLEDVVEFVHENYSSRLTLARIAKVAGVHPVHLSRVFRIHRGSTIAEYIRHLRIKRAQELLANPELTLAQIAIETGFADQSHFTRLFKTLTTKTPFQFRNDIR
ncbi:MAG: helix-turn-helix transcriptional regulator [Acidobacteriota bacterium]|nr:MAG: helix-turn-helix transcriptional regulator [Acidobacteriota bacterium]